jgi:hypothetical protein
MSELPITIAGWPKGRETVQVRLDNYNKRNVIDVRCWYTDDDGNLKPGRSGITLQTSQLPQLADGIGKALSRARDSNLIPGDASP